MAEFSIADRTGVCSAAACDAAVVVDPSIAAERVLVIDDVIAEASWREALILAAICDEEDADGFRLKRLWIRGNWS